MKIDDYDNITECGTDCCICMIVSIWLQYENDDYGYALFMEYGVCIDSDYCKVSTPFKQ